MRIWNLFEQSGTFKNVEKEMGYEAYDVDCVETPNVDYKVDLFQEIRKFRYGESSLLNKIDSDDLVMSFFPCTRFENQANMVIRAEQNPIIYSTDMERVRYSRDRENERSIMYHRFCEFWEAINIIGCKCVIENPYSTQHYLTRFFPIKPKIIIDDRTKYGDIYKKPTQFWFINFEPRNDLVAQYATTKAKAISDVAYGIKRSLIDKKFAEIFMKEFVGV